MKLQLKSKNNIKFLEKNIKFLDFRTHILCCIFTKIQKSFWHRVTYLYDENQIANSEYPDQTAPLEVYCL